MPHARQWQKSGPEMSVQHPLLSMTTMPDEADRAGLAVAGGSVTASQT
jgi:hypothetical protein